MADPNSQITGNPAPGLPLIEQVQATANSTKAALRAFSSLLLTIEQAGDGDMPRIKREAAAYAASLRTEEVTRG